MRRAGCVCLHLDHYCWFLQKAIGLRNRKFFILFCCYSLALTAFALALDLAELIPIHQRAHDTSAAALLPGVNATGVPEEEYFDVLERRQGDAAYAAAYAALGGSPRSGRVESHPR